MEMFSLAGDRALVVGGTSGIGLGAAQALKAAGALVTVASRSAARVTEAKAALGVEGEVLDAADDRAVEAFFADRPAWKHIVVSVTAHHTGPIQTLDMDEARAAMDAKFWSAVRVARFGRIDPDGSLTFVSGQLSKRPRAGAVLHSAINAGLEGLVRGLCVEIGPVRVNAIAPGLVETPQFADLPAEAIEKLVSATVDRLPLHRIGAPLDIGQAIVFLAANPYLTGSTLRIDGGSTVA